jgi:hypothetical protein
VKEIAKPFCTSPEFAGFTASGLGLGGFGTLACGTKEFHKFKIEAPLPMENTDRSDDRRTLAAPTPIQTTQPEPVAYQRPASDGPHQLRRLAR